MEKEAMKFYGQNEEDRVIWDLVQNLSMPRKVLDIGAFDGVTNSNSLNLIKQGWNGVLVEPSPWAFMKLMELHGSNPKVTLINAVIGTERRMVKFYECPGDQYSTTRESVRDLWANSGKAYRSYWVSQITIVNLMNECDASADVLSIDCEGVSVDILLSCPIGSWASKVVIVEHDGRVGEVAASMRNRGWMIQDLTAENATFYRP